jgi:hypothetical protein
LKVNVKTRSNNQKWIINYLKIGNNQNLENEEATG